MNVAKAQQAVEAAEGHKSKKEQVSGATLQPSGLQMGALGKPDGYMPPTMYSPTNQV
tara:strand:- start:316 stop:486 length:171 start_codon:yes stop_codon:yes gene_type:complete